MGNTAYSIRWLKPQNLSKAARELLSIDNGSVVALKVTANPVLVEGDAPCDQGNLNLVQETPSRMGSKSVNELHSKENVRQETVLPAWTTIQWKPRRDLTLRIKAELSKRLSKGQTLVSLRFIETRRYRIPGDQRRIVCYLYKCVIESVPVRAGQRATERKMLITSFNGRLWYSDPDKIEWR